MNLPDSGERATYTTGAQRDSQGGKGRFDLVPLDFLHWIFEGEKENYPDQAVWALARLYEAGAAKYEENNWKKGIPIHVYYNSAWRHLCKYRLGLMDEPHLTQFAWNILCMYWTELAIKNRGFDPELRIKMPSEFMPIVGQTLVFKLDSDDTELDHITFARGHMIRYLVDSQESTLYTALKHAVAALELQQRNTVL